MTSTPFYCPPLPGTEREVMSDEPRQYNLPIPAYVFVILTLAQGAVLAWGVFTIAAGVARDCGLVIGGLSVGWSLAFAIWTYRFRRRTA